MATNSFVPVPIDKAKDMLLGEGTLYKDYGEISEAVIGATRGGTTFELERSIKEVEYDGVMGATKSMRRYEMCIPRLVINLLKINYTNLVYGLNATVSDGSDQDGTYKKLTFDTDFNSTDVLTNLAFYGKKANGHYCIIFIYNAINNGNISFEWKAKDEIVSELTFTGCYGYATPTTPPVEIWEEIAS
jgi:hypothetical protein